MRILVLFTVLASMASAQTNETDVANTNAARKVRVTGDRVSLRAAPDLDGYVLDRAMRGDELVYLAETNGWTAVVPPETLDFWVAAEYVQDGVVQPELLNVRSGPSLNYAKVGELAGGDKVALRGEFNSWLKIAPPAGSRVWISGDYVEYIAPPEPVKEPDPPLAANPESGTPPDTAPVNDQEIVPKQEELPPLMLVLDKTRQQGVEVEIPGVLRRANPGLYQLVLVADGYEEPICLVRGQEAQMERYLNRTMLIKGKRYWAKDVDLPVVQPELIHLDPLLVE
jgi:SH3-like domain-containing protein